MWEHIIGHTEQKKFLQNYLQAKERPHALLFSGAAGLGKRTLALEFAKALLCFQHNGTDGCEACRLMNLQDGNLSHPDFVLVQHEWDDKKDRLRDTIIIDQIRELTAKTALAPVMSPTRVCIVEDADTMVPAAANAFLKLLEEPPAGWVIILLAVADYYVACGTAALSGNRAAAGGAGAAGKADRACQGRGIGAYQRRLNRLGAEFSCSQGATGCI